jgi:pSer/pThr/pTyr-binding forkhead associated (FHA) protein
MHTHPKSQTMNSAYKLTVLKGPDSGNTLFLDAGKKYLVGREAACDIPLHPSDKSVSRRHAVLNVSAKTITIENLSRTNPVLIKGKPIENSVIKKRGQFQIGNSLFEVKQARNSPSGEGGSGSGKMGVKLALFGLFLIVTAGVVYFSLSKDKSSNTHSGAAKTAQMEANKPLGKKPFTPLPQKMSAPKSTGIPVSEQDKKLSDEHFRQGMFFYDAGNMSRAIEQWEKAVSLYPDHPEARTWFLKAEKEVEDIVKQHYQNAMMHYKYLRYEEAAHEFKIVVQLSRNKNNDMYLDSLRYLDELQRN